VAKTVSEPGRHGTLERLAHSIRRLIGVAVTLQAPARTLAAASKAIDRLTDDLSSFVPEPPPSRYPTTQAENPADFFPYDFVLGRLNPLAPPVSVTWENERAVGRVTFGTPYEGPPGCVHGAVIAATFDQVFNVANLMSGTAGPTARLEIRYRRPTPLFRELRFEAWREKIQDRKIFSAGRLLAGDEVTAEASGLFVVLSAERVMKMLGDGDR
jgi:acyl-coenzyme A thioesterase PaaI-like protein